MQTIRLFICMVLIYFIHKNWTKAKLKIEWIEHSIMCKDDILEQLIDS